MSTGIYGLERLRRQPAAVLGAGVSGSGAGTLLRSLDWEYEIFDEQSRAFGWTEAQACSVVVFSPGFPKDHPWLELARKAGKLLLGEVDFASAFWPGRIVAVTGTNGKTTLVKFLELLLKDADRQVCIGGNVGNSFAEVVAKNPEPNCTAILELSSFQTESLKILRPDSVIWTNFDEDHLDRHHDMSSYFKAKACLVERLRGDCFLSGVSVLEYSDAKNLKLAREPMVVVREEAEKLKIPLSSPFSSYPQRENLALAMAFAEEEKISMKVFRDTMEKFHGEPHRLERVASFGNATFWNDSKATNFSATLAACKSFVEKPFWIGGGQSKGGDLERFARRMAELVSKAYLIGETGPELRRMLSSLGLPCLSYGDLAKATRAAFVDAKKFTDILFSPGFSSFDSFPNYAARGKSFIDVVLRLKNNARASTALS